jgi:hypothetical protein
VIGLLALTLLAAEAAERRYALLIGVNEGDPTEQTLHFAERDADRMARVLTTLGEVAEEDLVVLRGARAGRVREVLDRMEARVAADGAASVLLVYYSGHADAGSLHLDGTRLPLAELTERVEAIPAQMRVMVVDACRSGSLTRVKGARAVEPFAIEVPNHLQSSGTAVITSSSAGEDAAESDALEGGVFTHHLVAGLRGAADGSGDRRVTLTEAYRYAYAETLRATSAQAVVQHPTFAWDVRGKDELVLTSLAQTADTAALYLDREGAYLVFETGRAGRLVSELHVAAGALVSLPPGTYLVRRRGTDEAEEAELTLRAGETLALTEQELSMVPYGRSVRKGMATDAKVAWGLTLGGAVDGPLLTGLGVGGSGALGVRADLAQVTLVLRGRYGFHRSTNDDVALQQHRVGAELSFFKLFDIGRVAPGIGLRGGLDGVLQRFETRGVAPARDAFSPRLGPLLRLEVAAAARLSIGFEVGSDGVLVPGDDGVRVRVVPHGGVEVTAYAF